MTTKILIILLSTSTYLFGQNITRSDTLEVVQTYESLFSAIETNDHESLMEISTDQIYCIICFDSSDFSESPYMIEKEDFFENHLSSVRNSEAYQRATKSERIILINENGHRSDITALWTIYDRNELAPGHEGGQFGMYFKKKGEKFKFAGMETIP
ncbi:hypothetical protein [Fulvivirga ligni]|uniref:hypothetical protein n=1 Tax=Fulvivirga ligni TaxID=2904246 RepID=UPI001F3B4AF3|nr:hypothetical protein [Fulvivirga ligni]UII20470.1 hypothetical protein LVD16_21770 [Fulvivirga ligni]